MFAGLLCYGLDAARELQQHPPQSRAAFLDHAVRTKVLQILRYNLLYDFTTEGTMSFINP